MIPSSVPDDVVLHRAVLDHTTLCEVCTRGYQCPYLVRLRDLSRAASDEWAARADTAFAILEETAGYPESAMCRGAAMISAMDGHRLCERIGCGCTCHSS